MGHTALLPANTEDSVHPVDPRTLGSLPSPAQGGLLAAANHFTWNLYLLCQSEPKFLYQLSTCSWCYPLTRAPVGSLSVASLSVASLSSLPKEGLLCAFSH